MKKILSLTLSILFVISAFFSVGISVFAASDATGTCGDSVNFTFDSQEGILTLSGTGATKNYGAGNVDTLITPRTPWYSYRTDIKQVIVGEGITTLGNYVFSKMTNLTTAILPSTLTKISSYSFYQDSLLSSVNLGDTATESVGINAFENCSALSKMVIPNTMAEIGNYAFRNSGLSVVNLPDSCTTIGMEAFSNCKFVSLVLPETVTSVGVRSFANNLYLISAYVYNANLTFGGNDPFSNNRSDLTFYGHGGSTTQEYAESKGYGFVSIDTCTHTNTHIVVTIEPTCTGIGAENIVCDDCGAVLKTQTIAATGHTFEAIQIDDQTETKGHVFKYMRCSKCSDPQYDYIVTEHATDENSKLIWKDGYYKDTVISQVSCTKRGNVLRKCSVDDCSKLEYIYTPATGHNVENWNVTIEPTCTTDGSRTGTCSTCSETVTETIKGAHDYVCTQGEVGENGHRTDVYTCSKCNDSYTQLVHTDWVDGCYTTTKVTDASCLMTGVSRDTCTVEGCKETRNNVVPATGHSFKYVSCDTSNCSYKCANCDATRTYSLANVTSGYLKNMGGVADHITGYYYDINNDGFVNIRDYVLIDRLNASQAPPTE